MTWRLLAVVCGLGCFSFEPAAVPAEDLASAIDHSMPLSTIAFGSCANQDLPQPIWEAVVATKPQLFLFIGDTIYGDTTNPEEKRRAYEKLGAKPGYQKLKRTCPVFAVWDDHDYGINDMGGEHPNKARMQQVFLDFFEEPDDSPIRSQEGIYRANIFGPVGRRVQVIIFDTRYHRGPLSRVNIANGYVGYMPSEDTTVPLLGEMQWQWFEEQLKQPAEIRLIVSSIQVLPDNHPLEKWANLPHERERLFATLRRAEVGGVVFLSGDQHLGELSRQKGVLDYDAYELTSSGMTHTRGNVPAPNRYRVGRPTREKNFGLVTINWNADDPRIRLSVQNEQGAMQLQKDVLLSELQPTGNSMNVQAESRQ